LQETLRGDIASRAYGGGSKRDAKTVLLTINPHLKGGESGGLKLNG